ncbi:hypothetical protein R1sor_026239 [Riccia sorocarpa]|uniref:FCP1 homology domain-containing protein n=1 Tax=Riccia sorocarpa TaxID=122646 RepID=A0ABD3GCF4_9MARC
MEVLESSDSYKVEGDYHALKWVWSLSKVWKCDDASHSRLRGQQINLSLEAIHDAFHLPAGTTMCPKMKKCLHIEDWFDYYDEKKKAFWSNLCLKPGWAPILELLNALLLCRRYPKEVTGLLIWYIKTKVDPDGNPERIIQDVAPVDPGHENQVPQEGDSSEDESIPPGDHHEEDDEHMVPVGGGVEPPANDQPAAQDTTMEEVLSDDPSREGSAETGQSLPSHAKAGPSSSYREESGANLGSTHANKLERSKDLEPTNSGSERVRGPYIVHPIPSTIPSLLALRSAVKNCQPGEASRHSMEVDVSPDITKNPDTSGSEFLIVPRRADASKHLPWAQPMKEDVRPEITALSVPLGTDRVQDRNCTLAVENNAGVSSKHTPEQYCQEDGRDIIKSAPDTQITPMGTDTAQDRNCTPEARTKVRNRPEKGKKPAEECENPFRPEQLQQLQQLELKMMADLYSKQLDAQKLNEAFSFLLRQREEEMKRLAEREFRDNFKNDVLPWARELLKAIHVCELDLHAAYKQTRMIHKERWIEFARYGSAFYALRSIPTPDLERMIVENRAENYMNKFRFYEPLPCMNEEHDHYCPPGCDIVDGHICRVCSPAANTAQQTHLLVKQAGADQVIDPLFTGWNYGFHKIEELPDPMSLRYKPNIWYLGKEMVDLEALERSAFVVTESTPTPVGTVGTTESTPSGEASSRGANITPSEEESSRGANITPSGEGSSRGANITPSGEGSSRGADVTPSGKGTSHEAVTDVPGQVLEHGREPVESPLTPSQLEIAKGLEILMRFQRFGNVTPMQVTETHYSHRINLANYDIEGKSDERIRIAVAELLTEVEREVRQAGSVYFRILHKIFVGAGGDVPRWSEAYEWVMEKYLEMQIRCRNLTNTEYRLLNDLRELQPTAEALKHLQHRQKELRYVVEKLTSEVKILRRQKVALVVSVRSAVSYEGEGEHIPNKVEQPGKKTLVLELNGLLVKVANNRDSLFPCKETKYGIFKAANHIFYVVRNETYDFIFQCLIKSNLLLWSSRKGDNLTVIIRDMETRKLIPNLMNTKCVAIWAQEECEAHHTSREDHKGGVLYAKPLDKMYELNVSTRMVLMVDDSVEKNSTNHPHQAVHPPTFDPFKGKLGERQAVDRWDRLVEYWGLPVAEDLAFMFSSLSRRQQSGLQSEYLRKVADARKLRLTDVEAALEAAEQKNQAERDEWEKRKPPPPDEGAKRKPRPLVPQSGHAVEKDGMAEVLLQATRDPEMEAMPGSNL